MLACMFMLFSFQEQGGETQRGLDLLGKHWIICILELVRVMPIDVKAQRMIHCD